MNELRVLLLNFTALQPTVGRLGDVAKRPIHWRQIFPADHLQNQFAKASELADLQTAM